MVDLVKIRKKAKKGTGDAATESAVEVATAPTETREPSPPRTGETVPKADEGASEAAETPAPNKLDAFKEQAGRRREGFITQVADTASTAHIIELLTFMIGREQYAVDIERIVEIVPPRAVTRVPNADATVLGIISLRGTIVTIVDVRAKLRQEAVSPIEDRRVIVVDQRGELIGFEVDRVMRVIKIDATIIAPTPMVDTTEIDESIRGVFRHAGALTIQLDFDKLLSDTIEQPTHGTGHRSDLGAPSGGRNG